MTSTSPVHHPIYPNRRQSAAKEAAEKAGCRRTSPPQIIVLGPHALQNQLLSAFIHSRTGFPTRARESADGNSKETRPGTVDRRLYLIDCPAAPDSIPTRAVSSLVRSEAGMAALFNIAAGAAIEEEALSLGFRGVFYASDDAEMLIKGVKAMVSGELWFSREVTSRLLWRTCRARPAAAAAAGTLTRREVEILAQLAAGGNNQHIADALCISLHTVKTHLYNIYRKIGAENRLQASIWAANHLSSRHSALLGAALR